MAKEQEYVIFRMDGQLYGAAIGVVREVTYWTPSTRLPQAPAHVEGVIDLRGEILPVIDLRRRLGMPSREPDKETRLMILSLDDRSSALVVDGVDQVKTLLDEELAQPDGSLSHNAREYVTGIARVHGQLVVVLDLRSLMEGAVV